MQAALDVRACYLRYGPMVYRRCLRLLRSEAQAEEALHDVFVGLVQRREQLDDRALSSLLFRMATQVSLNRLRSRRRHPEDDDQRLLMQIANDELLEERSLAELVLSKLFAQEPASTRVMATMHYVDGMTLEEVAREFSMSVSGVRKRLRTLRARLSRLTEEEHERAAQ
jgi:RNA polymerase sigma-70 factor (ECF subfamily)